MVEVRLSARDPEGAAAAAGGPGGGGVAAVGRQRPGAVHDAPGVAAAGNSWPPVGVDVVVVVVVVVGSGGGDGRRSDDVCTWRRAGDWDLFGAR